MASGRGAATPLLAGGMLFLGVSRVAAGWPGGVLLRVDAGVTAPGAWQLPADGLGEDAGMAGWLRRLWVW
jgi:hypothetical protein